MRTTSITYSHTWRLASHRYIKNSRRLSSPQYRTRWLAKPVDPAKGLKVRPFQSTPKSSCSTTDGDYSRTLRSYVVLSACRRWAELWGPPARLAAEVGGWATHAFGVHRPGSMMFARAIRQANGRFIAYAARSKWHAGLTDGWKYSGVSVVTEQRLNCRPLSLSN